MHGGPNAWYGYYLAYYGHEEVSTKYPNKILPEYGYNKKDLERITGMILATKVPQQSKTLLEKILCNSYLDYLGTDEFYSIGETLKKEFLVLKGIKKKRNGISFR